MNALRNHGSKKQLATRPEVQACDYSDEISAEAFGKLREAVKDINDPAHKRVIIDGIDWPEAH
jgi:hypothetical protein